MIVELVVIVFDKERRSKTADSLYCIKTSCLSGRALAEKSL